MEKVITRTFIITFSFCVCGHKFEFSPFASHFLHDFEDANTGWKETWENTIQITLNQMNFTDPYRFIIEKQLQYCPSVSMCNMDIQPDRNFFLPCCRSCDCTSDCINKGTCCPDYISNISYEIKERSSYYTCVRPQLKKFNLEGKNVFYSYLMRNKFPSGYANETVKRNCESAEFPKSFQEFMNYIPVTLNDTGLTYRNKYCAICNNESVDRQTVWEATVACLGELFIFPKSFESLLQFLIKEDMCNILFIPKGSKLPEICNWGIFTECNQTGNMEQYDPRLDYGCQLYTSLYDDSCYRNVFCYLCNNNKEPQKFTECRCSPSPTYNVAAFAALLDFNVLKKENAGSYQSSAIRSEESKKCLPNEQYDDYKEICRQIQCPVGFININNTCQSVYLEEFYKSYEVYFRLTPIDDSIITSNCTCLSEVIQVTMIQKFPASADRFFCTIHVARHNESLSNLEQNEVCSNKYFLVHVEFEYLTYHHIEDVIKDMHQLDNDTIVVDEISCTSGQSKTYRINLENQNYGEIEFGNLDRKYVDPFSLKTLPSTSIKFDTKYFTCKPLRLLRIRKNMLCPHISLTKTDFNFSFFEGQICLVERDICFDSGYFEKKTNTVLICSRDYFSGVFRLLESNLDKTFTTKCRTSVKYALNAVTLTFTILSIICLLITLVVYCLFEELRTTPGKNNILLSINLLVAQSLFLFGSGQYQLLTGCKIIGLFLHFFWLASIFSMSSCTIHMVRTFASFNLKINDVGKSRNSIIIKYIIYNYTSASFFVLVNIVARLVKSNGQDIGYGGCICYISTRFMVFVTFALPIGLIILTNIIFFMAVIVSIQNLPPVENTTNMRRNTFLVYIKLSCLTGLTWTIGLINEWIESVVLSYLFIIFNAGHGLYLMLAFVCNKRTLSFAREHFGNSPRASKYRLSKKTGKSVTTKNDVSLSGKPESKLTRLSNSNDTRLCSHQESHI